MGWAPSGNDGDTRRGEQGLLQGRVSYGLYVARYTILPGRPMGKYVRKCENWFGRKFRKEGKTVRHFLELKWCNWRKMVNLAFAAKRATPGTRGNGKMANLVGALKG